MSERVRFPGVRRPKPLLSAETERALSSRQLELLDELETKLTSDRLGDSTMAEIAALVNCSLRTLYGIAPSKDELLLTLADRRLRRVGRAAIEHLDAAMDPIEMLRAYLRGTTKAVDAEAVLLTANLVGVRGGDRLIAAHTDYLTAITQNLLDRAVDAGSIAPVDTAAVAHVLGGLGREFARPGVSELVHGTPKQTADALADLVLAGLTAAR